MSYGRGFEAFQLLAHEFVARSKLDCAMAFNSNQAVNYLVSGRMPRRYGNAHPNAVPYQVFESRDGQIVVAVGNDGLFVSYCQAIGRPELSADPRFAKVSGRRSP